MLAPGTDLIPDLRADALSPSSVYLVPSDPLREIPLPSPDTDDRYRGHVLELLHEALHSLA